MTHQLQLHSLLDDAKALSISLPSSANATLFLTRSPHLDTHQFPTLQSNRTIITFHAGKYSISDDGRTPSIRVNGGLIGVATTQLVAGDVIEIGRPRGAQHHPVLAVRVSIAVKFSSSPSASRVCLGGHVPSFTFRLARSRSAPSTCRPLLPESSSSGSTASHSLLVASSRLFPAPSSSADTSRSASLPPALLSSALATSTSDRNQAGMPYGDLVNALRLNSASTTPSASASLSFRTDRLARTGGVQHSSPLQSAERALDQIREAWTHVRALPPPSAPDQSSRAVRASLPAQVAQKSSVPTSVLTSALSSVTPPSVHLISIHAPVHTTTLSDLRTHGPLQTAGLALDRILSAWRTTRASIVSASSARRSSGPSTAAPLSSVKRALFCVGAAWLTARREVGLDHCQTRPDAHRRERRSVSRHAARANHVFCDGSCSKSYIHDRRHPKLNAPLGTPSSAVLTPRLHC
ncbi:hypothetical protein CF326_g8963 [Tilletia indica]|nr:hypothetical protein CF326_g8963 [Tilletia indica]